MTLKSLTPRILVTTALASLAFALGACDVKKTEEGEMPKVNVEGGNLPKYDVDAPDVKVEGQKKTITVPDVDIVTPDEKKQGGNVESGDAGAPTTTPPATTNPPTPATPPAQ